MEARPEVRVRRGRRSDLPGVRSLLPVADPAARERFDRRTLASLAGDVYVAEDAAGGIVGVVSVAYLRSMSEGRYRAVLDAARADSPPLLDRLIAFAETRARRRGCRRLAAVLGPEDGVLRAALESRGYGRGDVLVADLGEARS
jgi:hypothetical protein